MNNMLTIFTTIGQITVLAIFLMLFYYLYLKISDYIRQRHIYLSNEMTRKTDMFYYKTKITNSIALIDIYDSEKEYKKNNFTNLTLCIGYPYYRSTKEAVRQFNRKIDEFEATIKDRCSKINKNNIQEIIEL